MSPLPPAGQDAHRHRPAPGSPAPPPSEAGTPSATADATADAAPSVSDDPTLALANRLRPVLLRLHRALRAEAHELGVTSTQASLLSAIQRCPKIGIGELARREHLSAPTLVGHIDKLAALGLVERCRHTTEDRRRVDLVLTPDGVAKVEMLRAQRTLWLASRLRDLPPESLAQVEAAVEPLSVLARRDA